MTICTMSKSNAMVSLAHTLVNIGVYFKRVVGLNPTRAALFSFLRKKSCLGSCLALFYIYRS